jgi:hypothetical protein
MYICVEEINRADTQAPTLLPWGIEERYTPVF